jgi:hypothetical protein
MIHSAAGALCLTTFAELEVGHFCPAPRKGKISRFQSWRVRKVYFLHSRSFGSEGQRDRLKARCKNRCEN